MEEKLLKLVHLTRSERQGEFEDNIDAIVRGYRAYLRHLKEEKAKGNFTTLAANYKKFFTLCQNISEETSAFRDLYEHVNIRSCSEAVCETIGSMMGTAMSNGRNLMPIYLHKEVFIRFNLPPFHTLKSSFIPQVADTWRKRNGKSFFRRYQKRSGMKLNEVSHTLQSFRERERAKSHFPVSLFAKK